jgi:5-methylcytosine-specific restriction endonuclease McrA
MTTRALLLNADYTPLRVIPWQRAIVLLLEGTVYQVQDYAGRAIRSAALALPWPAVVVLKRYRKVQHRVRFNRANVLARDNYTCAYCGAQPRGRARQPDLTALTIDHVVPRAQSNRARVRLPDGRRVGVTCWENVVACCIPCNAAKGPRTPGEAGMSMQFQPRVPSAWNVIRMSVMRVDIPDEWQAFVPRDWRDYWTAELQS